ncbi:hypothetical protein, partial [Mycobacterium sp. E2733]|uniref:hypothetical protein n=1 Tax=Mycobacterium sp. E2733 TaxID=1834138 RepID=UPI000AD1D494
LITRMLVREVSTTNTVALGRFYGARPRRSSRHPLRLALSRGELTAAAAVVAPAERAALVAVVAPLVVVRWSSPRRHLCRPALSGSHRDTGTAMVGPHRPESP